jgi:hypothetical protein
VGKIGPHALGSRDGIAVKLLPAEDGHLSGFLQSVTHADGVIQISGGDPND